VHALGAVEQVEQGQIVDRSYLRERPVMSDHAP